VIWITYAFLAAKRTEHPIDFTIFTLP
jgi:hypothetical protein